MKMVGIMLNKLKIIIKENKMHHNIIPKKRFSFRWIWVGVQTLALTGNVTLMISAQPVPNKYLISTITSTLAST